MKLNQNYQNLEESYLFSTIAKKVAAFQAAHPDKQLIRLGIGDVTQPLCESVVKAMADAVAEMGSRQGFHGYGPEQGYGFLHEAVCSYYQLRGVTLDTQEVFISDGAKSDLGNILDLFDRDNTVLIPDPVYPVYVDTNIMDGRRIVFLDATEENGFLPLPDPAVQADIIYICSPNNPTGAAYNRGQLQQWVDYANEKEAVILYDAAYEAFIREEDIPHSIFEIEGARTCAIEFCSLSKMAGFTGTRCGYTVVPRELKRGGMQINSLWLRRQTTKFNGVPYIVQRGAAAAFSPEGLKQNRENIARYMQNAAVIADTMRELGIWFTGGVNSPYIWLKCPNGMAAWDFFDYLLNELAVVGTPGAGFGKNGAQFFRLTAFGNYEETVAAMRRLRGALGAK